ncbi:hypothetical protein J5N97_022620 [Dioscorea zingiberensis]|uniref:AB hydrolase-1 domain-containing protein n=1 Tax=Dioscorea zingiberensis TaxID=325984 RepID=A0A9D5CBK2_9LILI|nr:hypothetical protein J5N97_022620 [Dioscorea zingiberensis]
MAVRVAAILFAVVAGWVYKSFMEPPKAKLCGSHNGPPITSPRIQLRDGRHLAYKESGVPKERAKYKVIHVHGFDSCKESTLNTSQELVEELGIYFLSFDRAGYGESDPHPKRSVKSEAMDIQELADQLQIGPKFYLVGVSMGAYPVRSCLNYIPHRLSGVALVVPIVNYWWPSLPANITKEVYGRLLLQDQRTFWIAHHLPFLFYAWMTQKWFPSLAALEGHPEIFSKQDREILRMRALTEKMNQFQKMARQQGVYESLHRDLMTLFSNWEFNPMKISNPFPNNEGSVHIWQGYEDRFVPVEIQRCVVEKLPWIHYHENAVGGHFYMDRQLA